MNGTLWLVKRELLRRRGQTVLLCLTAALAEAGLFAIFSLSAGYLRYFREQAVLLGEDPWALAWRGMLDVGKMLLGMAFQFWYGTAAAIPLRAREILSGEAALKNLPAFIVLASLAALIAVRCAVGLLLSANRRQRRHFLTSLLIGGADDDFIRRYVRTEALCVWGMAAPAALVLGAAALAALRCGAAAFFGGSFGAGPPVAIRGSLLCALAAALAVLRMTLRGFRKSRGGLSVKNAAREIRRKTGAMLGISALTGEPLHYRILGLPHYIAMRNIEDRLDRYLTIFLMTTVYLSSVGCFLLLLTFVRNSAADELASVPGGEVFFAANEFFFCASAAVTQLIATAGTVCGMISHIDSNTQEYVLLRSAGASRRVVRRCARREGALCVAVGIAVGLFWLFLLFSLFALVYDPLLSGGLDFITGVWKPLAVLGGFFLLFAVSVMAAVCAACRRTDRIDLLRELKELAYG